MPQTLECTFNSLDINKYHIDIDSDVYRETPSLKAGIKLPTNDKQWEMANKYFKANVNSGDMSLANDFIENFNEIFYSYFAENHGKSDNITDIKK